MIPEIEWSFVEVTNLPNCSGAHPRTVNVEERVLILTKAQSAFDFAVRPAVR
jgi:hypothetical protein